MGGDLNLFFNSSFETPGRNPILKNKYLAKLIEIKETLDLCDIWRIRNPKSRRFTFHQNHVSGRIQERLDYSSISNFLQETVVRVVVLASFCSDHSPVIFLLLLLLTREEKVCGNSINLCWLIMNTLSN